MKLLSLSMCASRRVSPEAVKKVIKKLLAETTCSLHSQPRTGQGPSLCLGDGIPLNFGTNDGNRTRFWRVKISYPSQVDDARIKKPRLLGRGSLVTQICKLSLHYRRSSKTFFNPIHHKA